jgi:hypothetical protein
MMLTSMVKTQTFQILEIVHNIQFKESMVFGQGKRLFTLSGAHGQSGG